MTSRRTFLISCSSVPLLSLSGSLVMAKPFEQDKLSELTPAQPKAEPGHAGFGIYGWHAPDVDTTQTHLISLTASWKADWL